jgi:hypothetical protein
VINTGRWSYSEDRNDADGANMMVEDDVIIGGVVVVLVGFQMFLRVGMRGAGW